MSVNRTDLAAAALREPGAAREFAPRQWDTLVRQARRGGMLARIADVFNASELVDTVPAGPSAHFRAATAIALAQQQQVLREVRHLSAALRPIGIPLLLLKGGAYLVAGLPAAAGRIFSDIDILVPKNRLAEVEAVLMVNGWATTQHSSYDQHYYRQWMHELPPMQHVHRQTVLDVHHTILPETARLKPNPDKLFAASIAVGEEADLRVLCPTDMVLHSMTHLFHNEELSHGLRDLSDLDLLLRHFGRDDTFWPALQARAEALDLTRPLYYGLQHTKRVFATPVPDPALRAVKAHAPAWPVPSLMQALWQRALRAPHPTTADCWTAPALFALYVRAHWLRMPPHLLLRHLSVKAWRRHVGEAASN